MHPPKQELILLQPREKPRIGHCDSISDHILQGRCERLINVIGESIAMNNWLDLRFPSKEVVSIEFCENQNGDLNNIISQMRGVRWRIRGRRIRSKINHG